jgi:AraC family transcriptional regulator
VSTISGATETSRLSDVSARITPPRQPGPGQMHLRPPAPEAHGFPNSAATQSIPAIVSMLIDGALAALDVHQGVPRGYLLRASALLQACSASKEPRCASPYSRGGLATRQLNRLVDYVEQHLADRITGEDLGQLIGVSIGQLFRAFKVSVGVPPLRYVTARRLEFACALLRRSSEPLSQIALASGFCDQSHFCRVFRRLMGIAPAAWRRAQCSGSPYQPTAPTAGAQVDEGGRRRPAC